MQQILAKPQRLPRQPPHSIEAEQSVMGGLLLNNSLYFDLAGRVSDADFYRADHQRIFRGIGELISANKPCDFVTLTEHLRKAGTLEEAGGPAYLASLAVDTYSIANVLAYADIVRERSVMRQLIGVGADIGDLGYRPEGLDAAGLLERAESMVLALGQRATSRAGGPLTSSQLVAACNTRIERMRRARAEKGSNVLAGLPTGFGALDYKTKGMEPGDVIIVAARPGMGKTALACNILEHLAVDNGIPAAAFSMEMSGEQLMLRVLSSLSRVPLSKLRSGDLSDEELDRLVRAQGTVTEAPIFIDETGALSPLELRSRARRLVARHGVKFIVVDYIQLMQVPGTRENRTNEVAEISRQLKALAKELRVPVMALCQLSREVEKRDNKRPRLSDLRDSGGIEQDADLVLFIYRDEVYDEQSKDKGRAEVIIGKQRQGPCGHLQLAYVGDYCKFDNLADEVEP